MSTPQATKPSAQASLSSRVPREVLYKLIAFALALAVLPISSYFITLDLLFEGNSTWAGIFAGIVANVILGAYVTLAVLEEDKSNQKQPPRGSAVRVESKKAQ